MKIKRNILFILFIIVNTMVNNLLAQDLSKLTVAERNKKLIAIAKDVYKAPGFKNFYREYGTPTISEMKSIEVSGSEYDRIYKDPNSAAYGGTNNQKFYIVYFSYDKNKERFTEAYAAKVYIWENTGKAYSIGLGNSISYNVRNGKTPISDITPPAIEYYNITYSKDVPDAASLPKTGKYGDLVTITLKTVTTEAYDGWTTEQGYNFDYNTDLTNGQFISERTENPAKNIEVKTIKIMVTGNMKVNVTKYQEEYEAPF